MSAIEEMLARAAAAREKMRAMELVAPSMGGEPAAKALFVQQVPPTQVIAAVRADPLTRMFVEEGKPPTPGLDITDIIAPLFPPLMLWKMGEWLPPEIAPAISPISAVSTMAQVFGTKETQEKLMERSILLKEGGVVGGVGGFPNVFGGLKDAGKWILIAGGVLAGIYILGKVLDRGKR